MMTNADFQKKLSGYMPARGDPLIRTISRPTDINANGHVFGGWVLSQMDLAGGIAARRITGWPVATVAIESMSFIEPLHIGDIVSIYADVERAGRTSLALRISVLATRAGIDKELKVTEGVFTFVALDENGRPMAFNA